MIARVSLHISIFILFILGHASQILGQKCVQIEKSGRAKTIKFYEGDAFFIKLTDEKYWREVMIIAFDMENNQIEFDIGDVRLDEIRALKTIKQKRAGRNIRNALLYSASTYALFGLVDLITRDNPNVGIIIGGLGLAPLGFLLEPIINFFGTHRFHHPRKRLRLVDLTFGPIP